LIKERKKLLLLKFEETDKRIQKQKAENNKQLSYKILEKDMKNEDISDSLEMNKYQMLFRKKQKLFEMRNRDKRLEKLQKEKIRINLQKKKLKDDLISRKNYLRNKVNLILSKGHYNSKIDIYRKVFSNDEFNEITKNLSPEELGNKTEYKNDFHKEDNKIRQKNEFNSESNEKNNDEEFFLTN
jgi:hypothetical protein